MLTLLFVGPIECRPYCGFLLLLLHPVSWSSINSHISAITALLLTYYTSSGEDSTRGWCTGSDAPGMVNLGGLHLSQFFLSILWIFWTFSGWVRHTKCTWSSFPKWVLCDTDWFMFIQVWKGWPLLLIPSEKGCQVKISISMKEGSA